MSKITSSKYIANKYIANEVFDIYVYSSDGLLFEIDSAKNISVSRDIENGENRLIVKDALLDLDLISDIFDGKYDDKNLRIHGRTILRDINSGKDRNAELDITVAKLIFYSAPFNNDNDTAVNLEFEFPNKDGYGFANVSLDRNMK
jgi:hypothetical protein